MTEIIQFNYIHERSLKLLYLSTVDWFQHMNIHIARQSLNHKTVLQPHFYKVIKVNGSSLNEFTVRDITHVNSINFGCLKSKVIRLALADFSLNINLTLLWIVHR